MSSAADAPRTTKAGLIDEADFKTTLTRLRGHAPVGVRLYCAATFKKSGAQMFIAELTQSALTEP